MSRTTYNLVDTDDQHGIAEERSVKKYNPDQPRVPAGSPEGGEFGEGGGTSQSKEPPKESPKPDSVKLPSHLLEIDLKQTETPESMMEIGKSVVKKMSSEEKKAVKDYTDTGYRVLNMHMRKCPPEFGCLSDEESSKWKSIEQAASKVDDFKEPVSVYRGIRVDSAIGKKLLSAMSSSAKSGKEISMPCLTSTSFSAKRSADAFATAYEDKMPIMYHITAKNGLPVEPITVNKGEHELLLSAKSKYRVVSVQKNEKVGDKYLRAIVHLEQI